MPSLSYNVVWAPRAVARVSVTEAERLISPEHMRVQTFPRMQTMSG